MSSETRVYPRKAMRCQARIALSNAASMKCRTVDVSLGGVSVMVPEQLSIGSTCAISFECLHNGKTLQVTAAARVVYSALSGQDGYRVGMQFLRMDPASQAVLAELMA